LATLLDVRDLVVHFFTDYGVVEAIDGCNLAVKEGEVVGLIGESGCGKTTTARAVLGVIPSPPGEIIGGEILFQGHDLLKMEKNKLNNTIRGKAITLIPQDPFSSFNPLFTIGTQMMDIMRWKTSGSKHDSTETGLHNSSVSSGRSKANKKFNRERIVNTLKQMQIPLPERQLRKYPHEFSGGQRQRFMIAMALLSNPSLIIADEPTTALDVTIEAQILQLLRKLVKEYELSVLYITHDLGVASQICDRVLVMYAGQVMETAPITSFFSNPLHPYTEKLLESLPNPKGEISDIPGEVPLLINPPTGCRFCTRCDFVEPRCSRERPVHKEILPDHWVSCFHPISGVNGSKSGDKLGQSRS
jgi:peptide/nickel transport system ATP-binding protein